MELTTFIILYLLFGLPIIVRSLILLGANLYRAGQTNSATPKTFEMPTLPRFGVGQNGKGKQPERHAADRLPDV